ncbi:MAG TPA: M56 family metallopeptidase [Sediminibacterium sp.]|nr:M56 family metallopeptidase [Sediminibacterium sp.]
MNNQAFFGYIIKTIMVSAVFFGYYWAALRNKKFHTYNRFYLIFSLAFSVLIPFIHLKWITIDQPAYEGTGVLFNYMINAAHQAQAPSWTGYDWITAIYVMMVALFLGRVLVNICKIYRLKRASVITSIGRIDFIETEDERAPFSFFNNLFWKRAVSPEQENGQKIFRHELTHIRQQHTLDNLFCQLICVVLWINPFFWLLQKELLAVHEFIADEEAVGDSNADGFARMLLQAHYGEHFLQQPQSFFYSSIKRRLIMLTTTSQTRFSYTRRLVSLPLLIMTMAVFSLQVNAHEASDILPAFSSGMQAPLKGAVLPVQEPARFPGGKPGWQKFLAATCNRDRVVEKGAGPGKYAVKLSFIVDKDGDIRDVTALNDPGYGAKEDAMRVLLSSPKWLPATLNGKKVLYREKITITYVVSEE